jgi:serine/threonine-protein kinase RIO1
VRRPSIPEAKLLDWHETAKEVRNYGAKAFEGERKRNFKDEQYQLLTGHAPKKQRVPLPIVRGIRKAAAKREKKQLEEAREAGIILPKPRSNKSKSKAADRTSQLFGPAPSIGAVRKGMLKLKGKPK